VQILQRQKSISQPGPSIFEQPCLLQKVVSIEFLLYPQKHVQNFGYSISCFSAAA
jgi:hypothetical protein